MTLSNSVHSADVCTAAPDQACLCRPASLEVQKGMPAPTFLLREVMPSRADLSVVAGTTSQDTTGEPLTTIIAPSTPLLNLEDVLEEISAKEIVIDNHREIVSIKRSYVECMRRMQPTPTDLPEHEARLADYERELALLEEEHADLVNILDEI